MVRKNSNASLEFPATSIVLPHTLVILTDEHEYFHDIVVVEELTSTIPIISVDSTFTDLTQPGASSGGMTNGIRARIN